MPKTDKKKRNGNETGFQPYDKARGDKARSDGLKKLNAEQPPAPAALPAALPTPTPMETHESDGENEPLHSQPLDSEDEMVSVMDVPYGDWAQVALPQPSNASKLTDEQLKKLYLRYLAIIDNIHDFFHKRGVNCPIPFKAKIVGEKDRLEAELQKSGINTELFLKNAVPVAETVMGEFESAYTIKILNRFGLIEGCHYLTGNVMNDNLIYESFIQVFMLSGQTFYTTHDAAFKKKKFRFDIKKEAGLNCKHYILKTPQNNFDSATSSASSSVIKKKTVIVYPENHVGVDGEHAWIFESNILTQPMGGKMSFKYAPESATGLLGSLALWKEFIGRKATFNYENKNNGTNIETKFKPIGAFGGTESGPGPKLLCESLSAAAEPLANPKTAAKKIYNEIVRNATLPPDEKYSLILDLKRSGDWEQVLAAKWFKENSGYEGSENTIVITGDYLCFLFAAINNVDCVFLGAKTSLFYSDKIRTYLKCADPVPSLKQSSQTGGDPDDEDYIDTGEDYSYTEEDFMDDFYTLLKNIRHNTMSWHYETIDDVVSEESYYDNIIVLIENFQTLLIENDNIKETKIYKNIDGILKVLRWFFDIDTNENPGTAASSSAEHKEAPPNLFVSNVLERSKHIHENYGMLSARSELPQYKETFMFKKIFLMSICILFEYLSLYYENDIPDVIPKEQTLSDPNIKPGFPHIIESFYYFIITNIIYKRNDSFNLRQDNAYETIIRFLAITYSLLGESLLEDKVLTNPWEPFKLAGFFQGIPKSIILQRYYPNLENIIAQAYYKHTAKIFLFSTTPSSSQSRGGARKNKMIRQIKKKKTKRKHIKKKTKRKIKIKGRKQKEENKTKNKKKKRKKTRRKKVIKRKKHTRRKHLNKSK